MLGEGSRCGECSELALLTKPSVPMHVTRTWLITFDGRPGLRGSWKLCTREDTVKLVKDVRTGSRFLGARLFAGRTGTAPHAKGIQFESAQPTGDQLRLLFLLVLLPVRVCVFGSATPHPKPFLRAPS